jgi:hypothetical protein
MASEHLSGGEALVELARLASVEHALVVEYLSVRCALGHDLEAEDGGATAARGRDAADTASSLAMSDMFRLRRINTALVSAGQVAELGRAASIPGDAGDISLAPPTAGELDRLLDREDQIAGAADVLARRLSQRLDTVTDLEGEVLDEIRAAVDDAALHAPAVAALRDLLGDLLPHDYLRATRREAHDSFEQRLLDLSDRIYGLTLDALRDQFSPRLATGQGPAVAAMLTLDDTNRLLVQRGLLPPFTPFT